MSMAGTVFIFVPYSPPASDPPGRQYCLYLSTPSGSQGTDDAYLDTTTASRCGRISPGSPLRRWRRWRYNPTLSRILYRRLCIGTPVGVDLRTA
jgi:hypothetical protein